MSEKGEKNTRKQQNGNILTIIESFLIMLLIVLVAFMMIQINRLQGTARVINYAGIVRGATQRLVKLEITQNPNDELLKYLDEVLEDLKYGDGTYELVVLNNADYQAKLSNLMSDWEELKKQIYTVREKENAEDERTVLLDMSENYFALADETVFAAEVYSDQIAKQIRLLEILSAFDMFWLFIIIVAQTALMVRMQRKNVVLAKKAYIDTHTGLRNKNMCEELLENRAPITEPTACILFDINNLKITNDTMGHSVGDKLIADFAGCLRSVISEADFVGRCGGDEFFVVLYKAKQNAAEEVLAKLREEVVHFNSLGKNVPISYAAGWSVSSDYKECTLRELFDAADRCMYKNKRESKCSRED